MKERAFYHYSIDGFKTNKNNEAIVDIHYGAGKAPLHIFKKDAERFIEAIMSTEERKERKIGRLVDGEEVEALNHLLKGRAMIFATDFKSYLEYSSNGQNGVREITGLSTDGNIDWGNAFDYKKLEPSGEDLYPIK